MGRKPMRWRLWIYEALTQAIIWLGWLRELAIPYEGGWVWKQRRDRTFDLYAPERWTCCDCGAMHHCQYFVEAPESVACHHIQPAPGLRPIGHCFPVRPSGYGYRLRLGAGAPSLAKPKGGDGGSS